MTDQPTYKNAKAPIESRVEDLLSRMTLEEKVGQMLQLDGRHDAVENLGKYNLGSYLHVLGDQAAELQGLAMQSRLGIPLLFGIDAIHGHSFWPGATIFPSQIGLACSFNEALCEKVGRVTAVEMSYTGVPWTFSPVLCLARDLRWGRIDETFGEDTLLVGNLADAMIRGYQGDDLTDRSSVLACAKHLAGYSETHGGRDASEADLSLRKLRSYFLPPFEKAARNGAATFMIGYQCIEGVPCTTNRWLLTETLRDQWGFAGFTVTDWNNVLRLVTEQFVCEDMKHAAALSVQAGSDMIMNTPTFYQGALDAVAEGLLDEALIDQACGRILATKFAMGLFEDQRLPDKAGQERTIGTAEHRAINLDAARESIVLLKNTESTLPLAADKLTKVAVIGPNADNPLSQLGDWSLGTGQAGKDKAHPRECVTTVLDGLRAKLDGKAEVVYAEGCGVTEDKLELIDEAVEAAKAADVAIVVVGDQQPFIGEMKSTATLELMGGQQALLEAVKATGTPMVVVMNSSKPLAIEWVAENADAVLQAWNPGMTGGEATAEILLGETNPSAKLAISFARHVGQQPVWYNQQPGQHGDKYADLTQVPLYRFGQGLSYTTYTYDNLALASTEIKTGEDVNLTVDVTNTGDRPGVEIVQVYLRDKVTSVTWPTKMLKAYARVALEAGQTETVSFSIAYNDLSIINAAGERVVEPGAFEVYAGASSDDEDLLTGEFTVLG